jgi:flavoprotein, HI0933 family
MKYDVVIVGAGAAGLLSAAMCAENGLKTAVIEKNEKTGRKLRITGKGRCNLTNDCTPEDVIAAVIKNGRFLYSALYTFSPADTMRFFEEKGVPLKVERGNRVFPVSDRADDVAYALESAARKAGAFFFRDTVREIAVENDVVVGVRTNKMLYEADSVIIACGGASYPATGSTGEGAKLAQKLGHDIVPLMPSLVPLVEKGDICKEMQGLSLKNSRIAVKKENKVVYEDFGELLFTHFGLSGPMILSASAHMRDAEEKNYTVEIDLKPALSEKQLDERIQRDFLENKNKDYANSLGALLPRKMIPVVIQLSHISAEKKCNEITKEERRRLVRLLKSFEIEIAGFRPLSEAIVTAGGVNLKEVNPKTMESKKVKGLFFAGEVLDLDAYTGGFNLQIAFSTAALAAKALNK